MIRFIHALSRYSLLWVIGAVILLLTAAALLLFAPGVLLTILRYGLVAVLSIAALSIIFSLVVGLLLMGRDHE